MVTFCVSTYRSRLTQALAQMVVGKLKGLLKDKHFVVIQVSGTPTNWTNTGLVCVCTALMEHNGLILLSASSPPAPLFDFPLPPSEQCRPDSSSLSVCSC
jgi:hypothetical protein